MWNDFAAWLCWSIGKLDKSGKDTWANLMKEDGKVIEMYLGVTRLQLRHQCEGRQNP